MMASSTAATATKATAMSSDDDSEYDTAADGIATTLPVIIQIKVKPDHRRQTHRRNRRRPNQWQSSEANEFPERHHDEPYLPHRYDDQLTAEFWRQPELDTREHWQIFERKPSDRFNQSLREMLSKSLVEAVSMGRHVTSPRDLLQHSSDSECKCDVVASTKAVEFVTEMPKLPMSSHPSSTASSSSSTSSSSRVTSVIEQPPVTPLPFSKVIEVVNPNGTLERDSGKCSLPHFNDDGHSTTTTNVYHVLRAARERMATESNEKSGTFISPKWIKAIEQPNKWMRFDEKKNDFPKMPIHTKPLPPPAAPLPLTKRPETSKRKPAQLQSKVVKKVLTTELKTTTSTPALDYYKIIDALHYGTNQEKCNVLDGLKGVSAQHTANDFVTFSNGKINDPIPFTCSI